MGAGLPLDNQRQKALQVRFQLTLHASQAGDLTESRDVPEGGEKTIITVWLEDHKCLETVFYGVHAYF